MIPSKSFPPVTKSDARTLILGSLPGVQSLKQQQYYAHKQNSFWRIMGVLVGATPDMAYDKRLRQLTKHKIALWDVCESAVRVGSLDSAIQLKTMTPNNFNAFFKTHRHMELICFNGQPAEKLFVRKVLPNLNKIYAEIPRVVLPSTSPAHAAMKFEQKLAVWQKHIS